mmetsp:Transcript_10971/g.22154  ORF Transcript_10971/g.22154 Transcript_10971/m.22154 type:complete len:91 (+) Transcript_10971:640-912(+)
MPSSSFERKVLVDVDNDVDKGGDGDNDNTNRCRRVTGGMIREGVLCQNAARAKGINGGGDDDDERDIAAVAIALATRITTPNAPRRIIKM